MSNKILISQSLYDLLMVFLEKAEPIVGRSDSADAFDEFADAYENIRRYLND